MTELEELIARRLGNAGADAQPPSGLADRIHRRVIIRRRRRRALLIGGVGVAAVLSIVIPMTVLTHIRPTSAVDAGGHELSELTDAGIAIPAQAPDGTAFTAEALGSDGTVLGRGPDLTVWEGGPSGKDLRSWGVTSRGGLAAGPGFRTWVGPEPDPADWDLYCAQPAGRAKMISPQGVDPEHPIWADDGVVVFHDVMGQPYAAKGCVTPQDFPYFPGTTVAFSNPHVFAAYTVLIGIGADPDEWRSRYKPALYEVEVTSAKTVAKHPLPTGVRPQTTSHNPQVWHAAANRDYFAWVVDDTLRVNDRRTWTTIREVKGLPAKDAVLRAGNRLIAYSGRDKSAVHDPTTGKTIEIDGPVFTAGDWVLWRESGDHYRLARVR